jgi:lactoylglutathione lyase
VRWYRSAKGGAALMLQECVKQGHDSTLTSRKVGEGVSLCFICDDAVAIYEDFRSRGIGASEPEVGNAMWVTGLSDTDGYCFYFESPTDTPEDTKLFGDSSHGMNHWNGCRAVNASGFDRRCRNQFAMSNAMNTE